MPPHYDIAKYVSLHQGWETYCFLRASVCLYLSVCLPKHTYAGNLVNATHPTVVAGSFLNLVGVLSMSEDVHDVWLQSSDYPLSSDIFCHFLRS